MQNILNKDFLTQKEVADYLEVSVGTVINRRKNGLLSYLRFPDSKRIMYPVEGIKEAVKKYTYPAKEVVNPKNKTSERKRKKPVVSATKQKEWRI